MNSTQRDFWITAVLLTSTFASVKLFSNRVAESLAAPLESIPHQMAGWSLSKGHVLDDGTLRVLSPTSYLSRTYERNHRLMDVFVAYYAVQRAGENMHSPKNCLPGSGWEIWRQDTTTVTVNGQLTRINKYSIQHLGQKCLVFYWYQSKKRVIASEYMGKLLLVRDSLVDGRTGGAIARVMVPDTEQDAEDASLFSTELIHELQRCFEHEKDELVIPKKIVIGF